MIVEHRERVIITLPQELYSSGSNEVLKALEGIRSVLSELLYNGAR
jgi:hypothetical protein